MEKNCLVNWHWITAVVPQMLLIRRTIFQFMLHRQGRRHFQEALIRGLKIAGSQIGKFLPAGSEEIWIQTCRKRYADVTVDLFFYDERYKGVKLDLSTRDQKIVKKILKASLKRLIREPILELKQTESKRAAGTV